MSQNGKGSKPRPYSVPYTDYCNNWDNIFKKKATKKKAVAQNYRECQKCLFGKINKDYTVFTCPFCDGTGRIPTD